MPGSRGSALRGLRARARGLRVELKERGTSEALRQEKRICGAIMALSMHSLLTLQGISVEDGIFMDFWARVYRDELEDLYQKYISVKPFTDKAIMSLFAWKNGGKLSDKKRKSVEQNYIFKQEHDSVKQAIQFPRNESILKLAAFAKGFLTIDFPEGGAIWRI